MDLAHLLQRLRTDNTSGATTLVELALDILEAFAAQASTPEPHDFRTALQDLVGAVLTAQPSMAVMLNLAQQVLQVGPAQAPRPVIKPLPEGRAKTPSADTVAEEGTEAASQNQGDAVLATARQHLQQTLAAFRHDLRCSTAALCQQALAILPPESTVLTYSNSATVIAALRYAHAGGRVRRVLLSESRPAYDGRLQARALLEHGIAVEYSIDMALFERLPEADVVLVGADAVFPHRLINKLGTHALAQLAQLWGVPLYSLCAASKFLPATATALWRIVDHPGEEVWPAAPHGLAISNRYFDATPLTLLRGLVSDQGLYTPEALRLLLEQRELSPVLLRLASGRASGDHESELAPDRTRLEGFEQR